MAKTELKILANFIDRIQLNPQETRRPTTLFNNARIKGQHQIFTPQYHQTGKEPTKA